MNKSLQFRELNSVMSHIQVYAKEPIQIKYFPNLSKKPVKRKYRSLFGLAAGQTASVICTVSTIDSNSILPSILPSCSSEARSG